MPYIITTRLVEGDPEAPRSADVMSRRAVATLDEAKGAVIRELAPRIGSAFEWDLGLAGGTVGPLPDGTVIAVERVGWSSLAASVGESWPQADRPQVFGRLMAAYNAEGFQPMTHG